MMRFMLRGGLLLTLAVMIPIGLIRAQPYDDAGLGALLLPPPDCSQPCWQGIQPNVTTASDAFTRMQQIGPIRELDRKLDTALGQIYWRWQQPSGYLNPDRNELAHIWIENNIVRNIYLPGFRSFAEVMLVLGQPDQVYIFRDNFIGGRQMVYLAVYPQEFYVASPYSCATHVAELLHSIPTIYIGREPVYDSASLQIYDPWEMRGWLPQRLCRTRTLR